MLSIESQAIYDILCDITELSEVYKIVDADEINEKLPVGITLTKVQLSQIIRDLKDRDYVEYCLRVIKRVDPVEKQTSVEEESADSTAVETEDSGERQLYGPKRGGGAVKPGLVLFMSFLGGVIGSGFVAAITAILLKFVI